MTSVRHALDGTDADSRDEDVVPRESPDAVLDRLDRWFPRLEDALGDASRSDFNDVSSLVSAAAELHRLQEAVGALPRWRPVARAADTAADLISHAYLAISGFVSAIEGSSPLDAQTAAKMSNREIALARESADDLARWNARHNDISAHDEVHGVLRALMNDAMNQVGARSLVELDAIARSELAEIADRDLDPGLSLQYAVMSNFASLFLDLGKFHSKTRSALAILLAADEVMTALLSDDDFTRDLLRLELELFDAGFACQRTVLHAVHERQAIKAAVAYHRKLVEISGRLLCSPLLLASRAKSKPYSRLRHDNATDLLTSTRRQPALLPLVAGLSTDLRTADAHLGLLHGSDGAIATELRGATKEYEADDIVELTFEAMESVLAGVVALRICAAALRSPIASEAVDLRDLGFSPDQIAELAFEGLGHEVQVHVSAAGRLEIKGDADIMRGLSPAIGACLSLLPDVEVTEIVVFADSAEWRCPSDAYRAFRHAASETKREASLLRIQRAWRGPEGVPWAGSDLVRRWVAARVIATWQLDFAERMRALREVRDLARELGDEEAASNATAAMRMSRIAESGNQLAEAEAADIVQMFSDLDDDDVVLV